MEPRPELRVVGTGRLERGGMVAVAAFRGADSVPAAQLRLAVLPTDAATVAADGTVTLRREGALTLTVTLPDGQAAHVVWTVVAPPAFVFDAVVGGNRDIYRVALDGGDLVRLTTSPADDAAPSSAAGTVVFSSFRNGQGDLYAVPLAGGAEARLTATPESELDPTLAADGRRLAFVRPARGVARVWVAANGAGAPAERLTTDTPQNAGRPEATPRWSADGRLAFVATTAGQADVTLAATAALPASLSPLAASSPASPDLEPAWSADGARIAFVSVRDGGAPALYVADAGGGEATRVTAPGVSVSQPTWLADGRIVLVVRRAAGPVVAWLDPALPTVLHDVPIPGELPGHPSALR